MSFFNPFRKSGEPVPERTEPTAGADGGEPPSSVQASSEPAPWEPVPEPAASAADGAAGKRPDPFDEVNAALGAAAQSAAAAKAPLEEAAPSPAFAAVASTASPAAPVQNAPAFAAVAPAPAAYDPYGIAAAQKAAKEAAEESGAPEADEEAAQEAPKPKKAARSSAAGVKISPEDQQIEAEAAARTVIDAPKPAPKIQPSIRPLEPEGVSEEELAARRRTKHRLVGAAAILVAAVVAAPFILDSGEDISTEGIDPTIPSISETTTTLEVPPVPPAAQTSGDHDVAESSIPSEGQTAQANLAQDAAMTPQKKAPAEKPAAQSAQKPAPKAEAVQPAAKAAADKKAAQARTEESEADKSVGIPVPEGSGFYVQVMATSSAREAERIVKRLTVLGLPAYRQPVERKAATLWRVRAGLFKTKKEAEGVVGTIVLNGIAAKPIIGQQ